MELRSDDAAPGRLGRLWGPGYFYRVGGVSRLLLIGILLTVLTTWVGLARRALPPAPSNAMDELGGDELAGDELAAGGREVWFRPDGLPLVETSSLAPVELPLRIEGPRRLEAGDRLSFGIIGPRGAGVLRMEVPLGTEWLAEQSSSCFVCTGRIAGSVCRCPLGALVGGARLGLQVLDRGSHGLPLPASIRLCAEREGEGLWACRTFEVGR